MDQYDYANKKIKSVRIKDAYLSYRTLKTPEQVDFIMNGMMRTQCKHRNNQLVDSLRNMLIETPGIVQDLFSLNVQRGRDHGMPDYNTVRKMLGIKPISTFAEISSDQETVKRLTRAIPSVNDIDLWIGIISEESFSGGNLGEVGAAIVGETFKRVREGDKYWYESAYPI